MKIELRSDSVTIEGYINAVERASKPLYSRLGRFIEKIRAGAFSRAIKRADDVRILLNHDWSRDLGGIKDGNLELEEDNIGLRFRAVITDPETIKDARNGDLVGCSFGFDDIDVTEVRDEESGLPFRIVRDLNLYEVSLLNRRKSPAYCGTLINVRDNGESMYIGEDNESAPEIIDLEERANEANTDTETEPANQEPEKKEVSSDYYARYKSQIAELKSLVKTNKED